MLHWLDELEEILFTEKSQECISLITIMFCYK